MTHHFHQTTPVPSVMLEPVWLSGTPKLPGHDKPPGEAGSCQTVVGAACPGGDVRCPNSSKAKWLREVEPRGHLNRIRSVSLQRWQRADKGRRK